MLPVSHLDGLDIFSAPGIGDYLNVQDAGRLIYASDEPTPQSEVSNGSVFSFPVRETILVGLLPPTSFEFKKICYHGTHRTINVPAGHFLQFMTIGLSWMELKTHNSLQKLLIVPFCHQEVTCLY